MLDWTIDESEMGSYNNKEIETGTYTAIIEKAEAQETKSGTAYLNIWWRIKGGNFDSKMAFQKIWLTDNAFNMFKMNMSKLGIKDQLVELSDYGEILTKAAQLLTNKVLHAEIYISYKDDGQYRNQNVSINEVFEGEIREDGIINHATKVGIDSSETLPF